VFPGAGIGTAGITGVDISTAAGTKALGRDRTGTVDGRCSAAGLASGIMAPADIRTGTAVVARTADITAASIRCTRTAIPAVTLTGTPAVTRTATTEPESS
jgi:hypothetical protein